MNIKDFILFFQYFSTIMAWDRRFTFTYPHTHAHTHTHAHIYMHIHNRTLRSLHQEICIKLASIFAATPLFKRNDRFDCNPCMIFIFDR